MIVQAAITGAIDFRDAAVHDRDWWTKLWWVLDGLYSERTLRSLDSALRFQQLMAAVATTDEEHNHYREQTTFLQNRLLQELFPWEDTGPTTAKAVVERMRQQYVQRIGDPADPKFQARVQGLIDYWAELRRKRRGESVR